MYKLYIYDSKGDKVTLRIRKNGLTRIQIKALLKVENREIREEKFLSLLLDSNNFKKRLSRRDCPCIFVLGHNYIKKDDTGYKFFEDVKIEVNYE